MTERPRLWTNPQVRASVVGWAFAILAVAAGMAGAGSLAVNALYAAALASAGFYFAREAVSELVEEREIGVELLMTLAIAGAVILGQWREAALVACLYSITEALEGYTIQRTRHAIRDLMELIPQTAHVVRNDAEVEVPVQEIRVGERVRIRPGESVPVDGVVRDGGSAVDESAITGESMPVDRAVGDAVFAGTINGNGTLLVEATKAFRDTTVQKIVALVEEAQAKKGETQLFVARFQKVYSPAVLAFTVLIGLTPLVLGGSASDWWRKAVTFLVAASPCALAIATPVTLVAAIGSAARRGVLIKGGSVLEALGRVRAVALDKTGTLTAGRPTFTGAFLPPGASEDELVGRAAAVERFSEHPLAHAVVEEAKRRGLELAAATEFRAITAAGVEAQVGGERIAVVKPSTARERGVRMDAAAEAWIGERQGAGQTVLVVAAGERLAGLIAVADTVRPEAANLVRSLKAAGVEHVVMLTGDNEGTARAIAGQLGIDEYLAGLLPEDKVARVTALRALYGSVAMVGDGINDAPALAAASVGIAMGTRGSDAAIAAADVALMADDLSKLAYAIDLAARSRRVIKQNIAISLAIVGVLMFGTLFAGLGMFAAVLSHEGSEVLIIANGLRVAVYPGALRARRGG